VRSPDRPSVGRREERRRFWAAIAAGRSSEDAADGAGVSASRERLRGTRPHRPAKRARFYPLRLRCSLSVSLASQKSRLMISRSNLLLADRSSVPASKFVTVAGRVPINAAICAWVNPQDRRIWRNSCLSIDLVTA
jgi:hypothetical protein